MKPTADPGFPAAASRLCVACGLCCNGTMFYSVQLQAQDSAPALVALGLKLKRRQRKHYLLQPCPALGLAGCSVYAQRPERCRRFACQQLQRLEAGKITEDEARGKIEEAKALVGRVIEWLGRCGRTDPGRPLTRRCEKIFAEPLLPEADGPSATARTGLSESLAALRLLLNQDFRLIPTEPGALGADFDAAESEVIVEAQAETAPGRFSPPSGKA